MFIAMFRVFPGPTFEQEAAQTLTVLIKAFGRNQGGIGISRPLPSRPLDQRAKDGVRLPAEIDRWFTLTSIVARISAKKSVVHAAEEKPADGKAGLRIIGLKMASEDLTLIFHELAGPR